MSMKTLIWAGLFLGSLIGGYVPTLWGASIFSTAAILGNAIGGILGIIGGYKLAQEWGL